MSGNVRSSYNTSATKSNVGVTKPRGGSRAEYVKYIFLKDVQKAIDFDF